MDKNKLSNIRLGILVVTGTILLLVSLYFLGSKKNLFGSSITIQTNFDNVSGLQEGNNVRYSGINIGTVDEIIIKNDTTILVTMLINSSLQGVIRKSAVATLGTDGLMGNKLVNIEPGTTDSDFLEDGDMIASVKSINPEEMLRTLDFTNRNIAKVSANLKNITENIDKSRGTLYTVLMDTSLASGFKKTLQNVESVSNKLEDITSSLSELTNDMNSNNGILGKVIKDTALAGDLHYTISSLRKTSESINKSSAELEKTMQQVNNGKGSISTLLNDSVTAVNLQLGIENFNTSVIKLNEDLEALKHSFLLRGYFRKQQKKK
jgi:phospholipid/cholesterol/gamma-HCH transport system substrate-binding protein